MRGFLFYIITRKEKNVCYQVENIWKNFEGANQTFAGIESFLSLITTYDIYIHKYILLVFWILPLILQNAFFRRYGYNTRETLELYIKQLNHLSSVLKVVMVFVDLSVLKRVSRDYLLEENMLEYFLCPSCDLLLS